MFWNRLSRSGAAAPSEKRSFVQAALPEGCRIYAIGDIHGRADLLVELRERIAADLADLPVAKPLLVFLGDYIDRGLHSRAVIEELVTGAFPAPTLPLRGNHEEMLLRFLRGPEIGDLWYRYGGLTTLHSYGVKVDLKSRRDFAWDAQELTRLMPQSHLDFLSGLQTSFTSGDYFFCHAGVRPGVPLDRQQPDDLLWIREEFTSSTRLHEKVVVHGHNPVLEPELLPNRINVDTGAYTSNRLSCVVLERAERRCLAAGVERQMEYLAP